jgi:hypothetical protein
MPMPASKNERSRIWLAIVVILAIAVVALRMQGRLWICACGRVDVWSGNINSSDNSQHIADPYSLTHVLHGLLFYGALALVVPRVPVRWRFVIAIAVEALWEVVENSAFVIGRYRATTLALGYEGDTVVNSVSDILFMAAGCWLARRLGFRRSAVVFVLAELILVVWIRDSLILNIIMLLVPIDAIKSWQMGG